MAEVLDGLSARDNMDSVIDDSSGAVDKTSEGGRATDEGITVLVVDDERSNVESLEKIFLKESMRVLVANDAKHALEQVRNHRVQVVLTDLMMPGTTGLELLRAIKQVQPEVEVVLMTAYGSVEAAVSAMREGAYDFVEKPLKRMTIVKSVRKAAERGRLLEENRSLKDEIKALTKREIVGSSVAWRRVIEVATQAAPSMATVLVLGESGTGKELLARYIHDRSARAKGPFVAVNCAAIPETILESELFGHERGAFTGAVTRRAGAFAEAAGGTLFLDEIGELPLDAQPKLLRALDGYEVRAVGGAGSGTRFEVRLVAATHVAINDRVDQGLFRRDLFHRLEVFVVDIPPLRHRPGDVAAIAARLLRRSSEGGQCRTLTSTALARLVAHDWPGNVRELRNVLVRATHLAGTALSISASDVDRALHARASQRPSLNPGVAKALLRDHGGNVSAAARAAGLPRTSFRKLVV